MDRAQDLERPLGVGDGVADERGLVRAHLALLVARAGVPGRRDDGLVVVDLAVLDDDPVRQDAARRLVEAEAALLALREDGLVEDRRVALADVLDEQLPVLRRRARRGRAARIMRAAWRPSVEWRIAGESFVFAMEPAVSSVLVAQRTVGSCFGAKPTRTCASGPTCMACRRSAAP